MESRMSQQKTRQILKAAERSLTASGERFIDKILFIY
jgi:hypothetical protein